MLLVTKDQELVKEIANQVLDTKAETVEALMETTLPNGKSVDERIKEAILTIGENGNVVLLSELNR